MAVGQVVTLTLHGSLKPDTAYMPVPRCDSCRHWKQHAAHPDVGRCDNITVDGAWQLVHTEASFGCVRWEGRT